MLLATQRIKWAVQAGLITPTVLSLHFGHQQKLKMRSQNPLMNPTYRSPCYLSLLIPIFIAVVVFNSLSTICYNDFQSLFPISGQFFLLSFFCIASRNSFLRYECKHIKLSWCQSVPYSFSNSAPTSLSTDYKNNSEKNHNEAARTLSKHPALMFS